MSEGNYNNDNEKDNENEEYGVLTITSKIKCNVNILIDEQDVATMNSGGDSINLDVPEGNHSLKVTVGYDTSLPFNFTINTGDKINLTITNSNLLRGFLILTGLFFLPLGIVWCIIPYTRNLLFHPLSINMEPNPIRNNKYSTLVRKHNNKENIMLQKQVIRNSHVKASDLLEFLGDKFQSEGCSVQVRNFGDNGYVKVQKNNDSKMKRFLGLASKAILKVDRSNDDLIIENSVHDMENHNENFGIARDWGSVALELLGFLLLAMGIIAIGTACDEILTRRIIACAIIGGVCTLCGIVMLIVAMSRFIGTLRGRVLGNRLFTEALDYLSKQK